MAKRKRPSGSSSNIKKQMGSGIDALFSGNRGEEALASGAPEVVRELSTHFLMLPVEQIERNPDQPRMDFDPDALQELADSIQVHGIIQPITVRRIEPKRYQIISGERRFRASQIAELTEIPAFIRLADDQALLEMALIENIQRQDLNPMEVAYSYYRLKEEFDLTDERVAERVGKRRATVTNYLRLLDLHPRVIDAIKTQDISMGHARAIAGIADKELQNVFLKEVLEKGYSVRDTEQAAKSYTKRPKKKRQFPQLNAEQQLMLDHFKAYFGTGKVKLAFDKDQDCAGEIIIEFKNEEQLTELFKSVEQ